MTNPELPKEAQHINYLANEIIGSIRTSRWQLLRQHRVRQMAKHPEVLIGQVESHLPNTLNTLELSLVAVALPVTESTRVEAVAVLTGLCAVRYVTKADTKSGALDKPTMPDWTSGAGQLTPFEFVSEWATAVTQRITQYQGTQPEQEKVA